MIHRITILFILNLIVSSVFSQTVTNVRPVIEGDKIIVHYRISGAKYYHIFKVSLYTYIYTDTGKIHQGPLEAVTGDVGDNITKGDKKIIWDVSKEDVDFVGEGDIVFDVRAEVIDVRKKSFFLTYFGSYYSPFGIQFGQLGKTGWYISARTNARLAKKTDYQYGSTIDIYNGYYVFDDKTHRSIFAVSAGLNFQWGRNFFWYLGGSYGKNQLFWHINEFAYPDDVQIGDAYVKAPYFSGFNIETGFMIRTKKILISGGVAIVFVGGNSSEFTFGLGYSLK